MGCDIQSNVEGSMHTGSRRRTARRFLVSAVSAGSLVAVSALGVGAASASGPSAHAARTISIKESASLKLDNHKGAVLKEHGTAKGTLTGPLYLQLRVNSTRSVTASVQVYPSGGGLSATASASYKVSGAYARFSGRLNITKGSGRYAKASGKNLSFSGTIKRTNDAITVYVSGRLSY
jgi:hypothetical protein